MTVHHCGAEMVVTLDALSRPREKCPKCDRVCRRESSLAPSLRGISQAEHAPPPPKAPSRRRVFIDEMWSPVTTVPKLKGNAAADAPRRRRHRQDGVVSTDAAWAAHRDREARDRASRRAPLVARKDVAPLPQAAPARSLREFSPPAPPPIYEAQLKKRRFKPRPCEKCGKEFTPTGTRHLVGPCCNPRPIEANHG